MSKFPPLSRNLFNSNLVLFRVDHPPLHGSTVNALQGLDLHKRAVVFQVDVVVHKDSGTHAKMGAGPSKKGNLDTQTIICDKTLVNQVRGPVIVYYFQIILHTTRANLLPNMLNNAQLTQREREELASARCDTLTVAGHDFAIAVCLNAEITASEGSASTEPQNFDAVALGRLAAFLHVIWRTTVSRQT